MNPDYVKKAIAEIEALDISPNKGNPLLYRILLMIYDELGVQTETQRHLIDAIYDLVEVIQNQRH